MAAKSSRAPRNRDGLPLRTLRAYVNNGIVCVQLSIWGTLVSNAGNRRVALDPQVWRMFAEDAPAQIRAAIGFLRSNEPDGAWQEIHSLLGACRFCRLDSLAEHASEIERDIRNHAPMQHVTEKLHRLEMDLERLLARPPIHDTPGGN